MEIGTTYYWQKDRATAPIGNPNKAKRVTTIVSDHTYDQGELIKTITKTTVSELIRVAIHRIETLETDPGLNDEWNRNRLTLDVLLKRVEPLEDPPVMLSVPVNLDELAISEIIFMAVMKIEALDLIPELEPDWVYIFSNLANVFTRATIFEAAAEYIKTDEFLNSRN